MPEVYTVEITTFQKKHSRLRNWHFRKYRTLNFRLIQELITFYIYYWKVCGCLYYSLLL